MTRAERRHKAWRGGQRCKEAVFDAYVEAAEAGAVCPSRMALTQTLGPCRESIDVAHKLLEESLLKKKEGARAVEGAWRQSIVKNVKKSALEFVTVGPDRDQAQRRRHAHQDRRLGAVDGVERRRAPPGHEVHVAPLPALRADVRVCRAGQPDLRLQAPR